MKLWIDDVRPAPEGYIWLRSVGETQAFILSYEWWKDGELDEADFAWLDDIGADDCGFIELVDIDHDAGDYVQFGGDYIRLLDWFEGTNRNYPIRIHSANPVGVANMRRIIERNGWKEVF